MADNGERDGGGRSMSGGAWKAEHKRRRLQDARPVTQKGRDGLTEGEGDNRSGVVLILRHKCKRLKPSSPI